VGSVIVPEHPPIASGSEIPLVASDTYYCQGAEVQAVSSLTGRLSRTGASACP